MPVTDSDALTTTRRPAGTRAAAAPDPLLALQHEFPRYRIWQEATCGRVRYTARSLEHGLHPHTVITGDLAELRAALAGVAVKPATDLETGH